MTQIGINNSNITIRETVRQEELTGKSVEQIKSEILTNVTTDTARENSGALKNNFDKGQVQSEINLQVDVTKKFDANRQEAKAEINKKLDEVKSAKDIGSLSQAEFEKKQQQLQNLGILVDSISAGLSAPTSSGLGITTASISPKVSYEIGQYFKSKDAEGSISHTLAHTLLGAAVAAVGGNDALTAGLSAGGAEAAAPLLSKYLYGKEAKDLTADEKGTVSAITGLVASGVGATTGDVASTVQSGQVAQNAVENNYQTKATLKAVNKHLQKCVSNDRACIEQGISILRKTDKMLDKAFNECVQTGNAACVEQHLKNILVSDASPEMKEMVKQLQRLKISGQVAGLLNETNGYASEAIKDVEAVRSGQDVGCVSGATTNCIGPTPEKTLGEKTIALVNELTLKQIWAAVGLKNDVLTGEEITANDKQLAILSMLSGGVLKVT